MLTRILASLIVCAFMVINLAMADKIETAFTGYIIESEKEVKLSEIVSSMPKKYQKLNWSIKKLHKSEFIYEIRLKKSIVGESSEFWDFSYSMLKNKNIKYFDPMFEPSTKDIKARNTLLNMNQKDFFEVATNNCDIPLEQRSRFKKNGVNICEFKSSDDFSWPDKKFLKFTKAWDFTNKKGEGVVIGHPDSGYTFHPEVFENVITSKSVDFVDDDKEATDSYEGYAHGHGTATSSVFISPQGYQPYKFTSDHIAVYGNNPNKAPYITGVAPKAKVISYRVMNGNVILFSFTKLTQAIKEATEQGVDVISISLGGPLPMPWLGRAIKKAVKKGVIIVAAAGNYIPDLIFDKFVVWPAAYKKTIAVAASDSDGFAWEHSSRGKKIDITVPGAGVWVARSKKRDYGKVTEVGRGSGTSFSVAYLVGAASLFLSHHGKDNLVEAYGSENMTNLFRYMLAKHAYTTPANWNSEEFGPGILDVYKLVSAPLPTKEELEQGFSVESTSSELEGIFPGSEAIISNHLRGSSALEVDASSDDTAVGVGNELSYHLSSDLELFGYFEELNKNQSQENIKNFKEKLKKMDPSEALKTHFEL